MFRFLDIFFNLFLLLPTFIERFNVYKNKTMQLARLLAFCFISLFLITSCGKDDVPGEVEENKGLTDFNLSNLQVGETFRFVLHQGEEYWTNGTNNLYQYSGDTLELEVTELRFGSVVIKESILPTSNMFNDPSPYYWMGKDSIYENQWSVVDDTLRVTDIKGTSERPESHLLYYTYSNTNEMLVPMNDFDGEEVNIDGWKTDHPYCECEIDLITTNLELLGNTYDRLNVAIRNTPMQLDGNGSTFVYSHNNGFVRTSNYSWWTGTGYGWDRIQ